MDWQTEIEAAALRTLGHVRRTPVMDVDLPGVGRITLKFEQMQHTGSFKARGAFNTLLSTPVPPAGVVAASGGNNGAAVAYAARALGYPCPDLCSGLCRSRQDRADPGAGSRSARRSGHLCRCRRPGAGLWGRDRCVADPSL